MKKFTPQAKDGYDRVLIEEISKIQSFALGEGAVTCQAGGEKLVEGDEILATFHQPPLNHTYKLGMVCCVDHGPCPETEYTLGVRELVVAGRIGWTSDQATQSCWPVLLAPHLHIVSPADTTEGRNVRDRAIKMTVPTTDEPNVWPAFLPDGEIELIDDPETLEEGESD